MPVVDILLPTCNRLESLVMTLSGVAAQTVADVHLVVSRPARPSGLARRAHAAARYRGQGRGGGAS